jgi:hypothetical protein
MVKSNEDVIKYSTSFLFKKTLLIEGRDFNKTVNMTAEELEKWLKGSSSKESGWSKSDGSGESIGHERYSRYSGFLSVNIVLTILSWPENYRNPKEESEEGPF